MNTRSSAISVVALLLLGCEPSKPGGEGGAGSVDTGSLDNGDEGGDDGTGDEGPGGDEGGDEASDGSDDGGDEGGDEGEPEPDPITATVQGTVIVELYEVVDGARQPVDWADYSADFPFGPIFVASYEDDGLGGQDYRGTDTILEPTQAANPFEITVSMPAPGPVELYAMLDENGNRIMESSEPIGAWTTPVEVVEGGLTTDVEITILVDVTGMVGDGGSGSSGSGGSGSGGSGSGGSGSGGSGSGGSGGSGSGGSGSGGEGSGSGGSGSGGSGSGGSGSGGSGSSDPGDCPTVEISGPVTVLDDFEGEGLAMLNTLDGTGPIAWDWFETTLGSSGGASASYRITTCENLGNVQLTGLIDSNGNMLADPADTSGAYVTSPDVNGNPITVSTSDLLNHEVQIPILDATTGEPETNGVRIVPFVTISGELTYDEGRIDGLDAGTAVYVTALKYRPTGGVSASGLAADAYDSQSFDWASDIDGNASLSYRLVVPANQTVYLWAYGDPDLDGNVNESGEPVASGGTDDGAYETTDSSTTQDLDLRTVE